MCQTVTDQTLYSNIILPVFSILQLNLFSNVFFFKNIVSALLISLLAYFCHQCVLIKMINYRQRPNGLTFIQPKRVFKYDLCTLT